MVYGVLQYDYLLVLRSTEPPFGPGAYRQPPERTGYTVLWYPDGQ